MLPPSCNISKGINTTKYIEYKKACIPDICAGIFLTAFQWGYTSPPPMRTANLNYWSAPILCWMSGVEAIQTGKQPIGCNENNFRISISLDQFWSEHQGHNPYSQRQAFGDILWSERRDLSIMGLLRGEARLQWDQTSVWQVFWGATPECRAAVCPHRCNGAVEQHTDQNQRAAWTYKPNWCLGLHFGQLNIHKYIKIAHLN